MRTLGIIVLCVALLIGGAVVGYRLAYPIYTYRYRMTVEVEVNGRIESGSSVIEVRVEKQPQWPQSGFPIVVRVSGEAAFVDLGNGRNVVALLAADGGSYVDYPAYVVPAHAKLSYDDKDLPKFPRLTGHWQLNPTERRRTLGLPTLVTFTDLNDPKSARTLLPDDFAKVFGPDVTFKRISIEMTKDLVTEGIEKKYPWWNGPFPWLKPIGNETYVDTRPRDQFRWNKGMFKRNY